MNTRSNTRTSSRAQRAACAAVALAVFAAVSGSAFAGPREQAKRLHDRIASVPPSAQVLDNMANAISNGQASAAAAMATDNPAFYNVTLKNFAAPWTNRDLNIFVPLNDYTATVIGMVRDDVPFNTVLSDDILYIGNGVTPAYSPANNAHYAAMESSGANLATVLTRTTQSSLTGIPSAATAGVMTTRAAAKAFFVAGTNRAMFRFTMLNHLCRDMEQVMDTSRSPDMIRQDVARSPGGDSRVFLNNCVGCHSGMDPLARAFAYYNYELTDETNDIGQIRYTAGQVQPKYLINSDNFKPGFVTPDDSWTNRWRAGPNVHLGWSAQLPGSGSGAKSMGAELANSDAFASCQVEKVFKRVCFRAPSDAGDRAAMTTIVNNFKTNYNLKRVFQEVGVHCMGN